MATSDNAATPDRQRARAAAILSDPPKWLEIALWAALFFTVAGIRIYLIHLVPVHLWSKDAGSYASPVWRWLEEGVWQTDPRRGPVYSLLIAGCLKLWHTFDAVMVTQHVLGGSAVLVAIIVLRLLHGRRAIVPVFLCGYSYAVYAAPLHMEHLIRNETLLLLFATLSLAGWYLALRQHPAGGAWLWLAGIAASLLALTKNVFAPFPLIVLAGVIWLGRARPLLAVRHAGIFLVALALPFVAAKALQRVTLKEKPPAPQTGLLLYSRVAQFTVLGAGIEPDIKQVMRQDVEDYRALVHRTGELQHNVALNETIVPRLRSHCLQSGKTLVDLNQLCRRLAFEAIKAHPIEYARQVLWDLRTLQLKGSNARAPGAKDLFAARQLVEAAGADPDARVPDTSETLRARENARHFFWYKVAVTTAWLWVFPPGLLTSIFVTFFTWRSHGSLRLWWITLAGVWWFNLLVLSTVASPQDRYLIPVTPVMFWSLSSAVILAWNRIFPVVNSAAATANKPVLHS